MLSPYVSCAYFCHWFRVVRAPGWLTSCQNARVLTGQRCAPGMSTTCPSFSALCVRRSQAPPRAIMQTDYSVNTMNLATPETPLTSIGLPPVGFAPTIVRDRPRARRSDSFSGARRGHDPRAARLRRRGLPWPARWWSNTRPSNARRLTKGAAIGRTPVERCAAAQVISAIRMEPARARC
jgi:hypothetical protein